MTHRVARALLGAGVLAATVGTGVLTAPVASAATTVTGDPFTIAWQDTFRGNITQTGNTLIACDPDASAPWIALLGANACEQSMNFELAAATGNRRLDSNYGPFRTPDMPFADATYNHSTGVKAASSTPSTMVNSSSATLTVPAGAKVRKALLVWGGCLEGCPEPLESGEPADSMRGADLYPGLPADGSTAKFRTPGGGWSSVTAEAVLEDTSKQDERAMVRSYSASLDVTNAVREAGSGVYSVGDVQFLNGATNLYAGWSLHVAYELESDPVITAAFWRGQQVTGNGAIEIGLDGLNIPTSGPFNPRFMTAAQDGDPEPQGGDRLSINGELVTQAPHREVEFLSGRITGVDGAYMTGRSPSTPNTYGWDLATIDSPAGLDLGDTSVVVTPEGFGGEGIHPYFYALAVPVNEPVLEIAKDDGKVDVGVGQETTYTITATNTGTGDEPGAIITDTLPPNTSFVEASDGGTHTSGVVTWDNVAIAAGESVTRSVTVRIDAPTDDGRVVNNVTISGEGQPEPNCDDVNDEKRCAQDVDLLHTLKIDKVLGSGEGKAGGDTSWDITVKNTGPGTASDVVVTDLGGEGFDPESVEVSDPSQGDATGGEWAVGTLEAGETATATVNVKVAADYDGVTPLVNTAVVGNPSNPAPPGEECVPNTDVDADTDQCDSDVLSGDPAITVVKFSTDDPVKGDYDETPAPLDPNATTAVTVRVTNSGGQDLSDITLTDVTDDGEKVTGLDECEIPEVLKIGEAFDCVGTLPAIGDGATHKNTVTVDAVGTGGKKVTGKDPWMGATKAPAPPAPSAPPVTPPAGGSILSGVPAVDGWNLGLLALAGSALAAGMGALVARTRRQVKA